ncbi:MAG: hypothetical protein AB1422_03390 [bacterium]
MNLRLIFINIFIILIILPISVLGQEVILTKEVDKISANPSDIVTYKITYQNLTSVSLNEIAIIDVVPANTIFQEAGNMNTTVYYCHDNNDDFDTLPILPVTKVKWLLNNPVEGGGVGSVTLRLKIK